MYRRVAPRDLFNESKLLKCLGRLAVLIHDEMAPKGLSFEQTGGEFRIDQRIAGDLYVRSGIKFMLHGKKLRIHSPYNSKEAYPLLCEDKELGEIEIFNDDGSFSDEFLEYCKESVTT